MAWDLWTGCYKASGGCTYCYYYVPYSKRFGQNIIVHAVEYYRKTEENKFPYMLCAFVSKNSKTDGYKTVHIPAQTYAIFPSERFRWEEDF